MRKLRLHTGSALFCSALIATVVGVGLYFDHAWRTGTPVVAAAVLPMRGDFAHVRASPQVRRIALWAVDSGDHLGHPFMIVDKTHARVFVFDEAGRLRVVTNTLLGALPGDGAQSAMTPAGRFTSSGIGATGELAWHSGAVQLTLKGLLRDTSPGQGRKRLASSEVADKRISDGSLHVRDDILDQKIGPLMRGRPSIAYVLPELGSAEDLFGAYDVDRRERYEPVAVTPQVSVNVAVLSAANVGVSTTPVD